MYPKAVLDTNVYLSALHFGGKPDLILRLSRGRAKRFELYTSPAILKEVSVVLSYDKFLWSEPRITKAIQRIVAMAEVVETKKSISVAPDETDNRILECAVKAKANYIVSGDKHLLDLKEYEGIKIIAPAQFLKMLEK